MPRWSLPSPLWGINVPKGQVGFFSLSFRAAGAARGDVTARKHQPHLGRCSRLRLGGAEEQRAGHRHRSGASKAAPVPGKLHPGDYPEVRSSLEPRCSLRGFSSLFSGSSSPLTPFPLRVNPGLNASLFFGPTKFPAPLSPVGSPGELSARCSGPTVIPNVPPGAAAPCPLPGLGPGLPHARPEGIHPPSERNWNFQRSADVSSQRINLWKNLARSPSLSGGTKPSPILDLRWGPEQPLERRRESQSGAAPSAPLPREGSGVNSPPARAVRQPCNSPGRN